MALSRTLPSIKIAANIRRQLTKLTPIESESGLLVKRDDLFSIEKGSAIRGGKLRQCLLMLDGLSADRIISAGSIHSPQLAIVAYAANLVGVPCTILAGGKQETTSLSLARRFRADIIRCKTGRHTVLFAKAEELARSGGFTIPFGMRPRSPVSGFYETCGSQVLNIPSTVDEIVVASGSGVTVTAIAYALWKARRKIILNVINVGPDRRRQILQTLFALNPACSAWADESSILRIFPLGQGSTFRYEVPVPFKLGRIPVHPLYEGKAFSWFFQNVSFTRNRTLFWLTGPLLRF
jgi:1-aminocyclopropane-1-carboxylate deaminase/D-cysteine desulfhydrase-like pyridoxal-dependent ACC family enzyme